MPTVFISYRRQDSQGFAGRIEDDLSERLGDEQVFRDREIPAGTDFVDHLESHLARASVVLVLIGRDWLDARDAEGFRRLDRAGDWVRREIELALARKLPLLPVLVGGASMPAAEQLPASIRALSRRQAFVLGDQRWHRDLDELTARLRALSPALGQGPSRQSVAARAGTANMPPSSRGSSGGVFGRAAVMRALRWLAGRLGKLAASLATLAAVYILIRALGGAQLNHMLDRVIATTLQQLRSLIG